MNPESIQTLFSYNYWAFDRVWECIAQLTDDQFTQPVNYSRGSIRNQVVHLMSATQRWVYRLQRAEVPPRLVFEDFASILKTSAKWDELQVEALPYFTSLTEGQLNEVIRWELPERGISAENRRWEILLHVANHGTDHRAQILAVLNEHFGIETPEQDLVIYLRERQEKPAYFFFAFDRDEYEIKNLHQPPLSGRP